MIIVQHHHVLFLGSETALLVPAGESRTRHTPLSAARNDIHAWQTLRDCLHASPQIGYTLVLDTAGIVLRAEAVPSLGKADCHALLARRLETTFPDTPLRWVVPWKRRKALLVGMRPQGVHAPWLEAVRALNNPCRGIDLAPFMMASLAHRLVPAVRHGWTLVLSFHHAHASGGRQVVLNDGLPVFTTLLAHPITQSPSLAMAALTLDLEATRAWMKRLGWTPEQPVRLVALMPAAWHSAIPALGFMPTLAHVFSPHEAARAVKATRIPDPQEACADGVLAGMTGLGWQRNRFLLPAGRI